MGLTEACPWKQRRRFAVCGRFCSGVWCREKVADMGTEVVPTKAHPRMCDCVYSGRLHANTSSQTGIRYCHGPNAPGIYTRYVHNKYFTSTYTYYKYYMTASTGRSAVERGVAGVSLRWV